MSCSDRHLPLKYPQCTCTVASWLINLPDVSLYSGCFIVFQVNNLKKLVKGVHDYYTEVCMLGGLILLIMCIRGMHGQKLIDKLSLHLQLTPSINPSSMFDLRSIGTSADTQSVFYPHLGRQSTINQLSTNC